MEEINQNSQTSLDFNLGILKPNNENDLRDAIKHCYKKDLPIEVVGAGTKNQIGKKLQCAKILDMSNLSGIIEYKPEELYITVKAGTPIKIITEELKKNNQHLAFEPINFSENISPIRGTPFMYKYGDNVALFNFELRAPVLLYYFPAIKWVGQINGVAFLDVGVVWNNNTQFPKFSDEENWVYREEDATKTQGWVMSYGWGPRFIFLGLPWKINYAWQYNPHKGTISERQWYLTIGLDF